jgi:hypothetical protein
VVHSTTTFPSQALGFQPWVACAKAIRASRIDLIFLAGLFFLLFLPALSFGQSPLACHQKEGALMERDVENRRICIDMFGVGVTTEAEAWQSLKRSNECHVRRVIRYAEESCVPAKRASLKVQLFLFQQTLRDVEEGERGQINFAQFLDRSKRNWTLIKEEIAESSRQSLDDLKNTRAHEADVMASKRIERALSILGTMSGSSASTRTYIMNGRHITCRDQSGYTICN